MAATPGEGAEAGLQALSDAHEVVRRRVPSTRKAWERLYDAQRSVEDTRLASADALAAGGDPEAAFWAAADLLQPGFGNLPGENYLYSPPPSRVGSALSTHGAAAWARLSASRGTSDSVPLLFRALALWNVWRSRDAQGVPRCGTEAWPCPSPEIDAELGAWMAEVADEQALLAGQAPSESQRYLRARLAEYFRGAWFEPRLDHRLLPIVVADRGGDCAADAAIVVDALNRSATPRSSSPIALPGVSEVVVRLDSCEVGQSRDLRERFVQTGTETVTRTVAVRSSGTRYTSGPGYVGTIDWTAATPEIVTYEVPTFEEYQETYWNQAVGLRGAFVIRGGFGADESAFALFGAQTLREDDGATLEARHASAVAHVVRRERYPLEDHLRRALAARLLSRLDPDGSDAEDLALYAYALHPALAEREVEPLLDALRIGPEVLFALTFAQPHTPVGSASAWRLPWPTLDPRDAAVPKKLPKGADARIAACEAGDDHVCVEVAAELRESGRGGQASDLQALACVRAGLGCRVAIDETRAALQRTGFELPWVADVRARLAELVTAECHWRGGTWSGRDACVFLD